MVAAQRTKASDKHDICKKLLTVLKKSFPPPPKIPERPVLETILFAVCLENSSIAAGEESYARLFKSFHDLNEIRVSSMEELEAVFQSMSDPEWRALRTRNVLQYIFESHYSFDFESLKRKTLELATKQISKIKTLSPFVRAYVLSHALGAHLLPIDDRMQAALTWLDLLPANTTPEQASEILRACVRKAEGAEFCHYIRALGTDSKYQAVFAAGLKAGSSAADGNALLPAVRLEQLLKGEGSGGRGKKAPPKKLHASRTTASDSARSKKAPTKPSLMAAGKGAKGKVNNKKSLTVSDGKKGDKKVKKTAARSSR